MTTKKPRPYDYMKHVTAEHKDGHAKAKWLFRKLIRDALLACDELPDFEHGRYVPAKTRISKVVKGLVP